MPSPASATRRRFAIHQFFTQEGFFWVNTPIITASDAEGAGQMFRVSTLDAHNLPKTDAGKVDWKQDFFGREAFLTVSGQLNVEAYCLALSKVYTFGPTFRAENSNTTRHLAEFWMIEPEIAFADLAADADLAERFLKHIFNYVLQEAHGRPEVLRRADPEGRHRATGDVPAAVVRTHRLHGGDHDPAAGEEEVRLRARSGAWTCRPSTSATCARSTSGDRWW